MSENTSENNKPWKEKEIPLSQNALRLIDFDKRIKTLEEKTNVVNELVQTDSVTIEDCKTGIKKIHNETDEKISASNEMIITKIKDKFTQDLSNGEKIIEDNEEQCDELTKKIDEVHQEILNHEAHSNEKILVYRRKKKEFEDLTHQYNILKEGYDDAAKTNVSLREANDKGVAKIASLEVEIEDMKQVIAKLTDARMILNKYFSTHYENFSEPEKKLIQDIEGNVFPGHYNTNPVLPDINGLTKSIGTNPNKMNINMNVVREQTANKLKGSDRYEKENQQPIKTILNEEEYGEYQKKWRNGGVNVQVSTSWPPLRNNNSNTYSKNYFGPDDDYWYEQTKKNK